MSVGKRKCPHCKIYNRPSEGVLIKGSLYCNMDCAVQKAKQGIPKGKAIKAKAQKKEVFKEKQERLYNNFPHQLELTRVACNTFIRTLDKDKPCICCNKPTEGREVHAGHFKPVSSHPELRFDPRNIYLQLGGCNLKVKHKRITERRMEEEYEENLLFLYGQELVDWLNTQQKSKHYTCDDLRELRKMFYAETKRLKSGLPPSKDWRALPI